MQSKYLIRSQLAIALLGALGIGLLAMPTAVVAQSSSATLRGHITAAQGQMPTQVVATNLASGFVTQTQVDGKGNYTLPGLAPGSYSIQASGNGASASQAVTVQIGQSLILDLNASATPSTANATEMPVVTVTADVLTEERTSEVAQNISQAQIKYLPQNEHNFLDFAKLVPGITTSTDSNQKSFSAGGQTPQNVNVFIDGASLKNNVLKGGLVGQDSSRGNPFSQEAVKEFRVLVQNYKAEYEQAGTAVISAVTKSGSNEFHGSVFDAFQNRGMISQDRFAKQRGDEKPDYHRNQGGFSLGGPIIKDTLLFFVNYEERDDVTNNSVVFTDPRFTQYNGNFPAPFKEKVSFGKLSWQINPHNNIDFSFSRRRDQEVLGFGGTTAYSARTERKNAVDSGLLKWQSYGNTWLNEVLVNYGRYNWKPVAANFDGIRQNFEGVGVIGSASNFQDKGQTKNSLRDDFTWYGLDWHGQHTMKFGFRYADYSVSLLQNNNAVPTYTYQEGDNYPGGFDIPYRAVYAPEAANVNLDTHQFGIYVQDDWDVTERLQLNLGLRWDYDSNALNNNYVTPQQQYATLQYLGLDDYISTGSEREAYKGAIQPRFGFSLDVSPDADQSTTVFGGAGRYYDHTPLDWISQEANHATVPFYTFNFSPANADGTPSQPGTIAWDPAYLNADGLKQLLASGTPGFTSEIDAINNDTKPPYTDQFSLGVRHVLGHDWVGSVTLARVLGYRQFTWVWNRKVEPGFVLDQLPGSPYGVVLHNVYANTQSSSLLFSLRKPYTPQTGWGAEVSYTYQDAHKTGGDNYSLDYVMPSDYPANNVGEKHHLVASGIINGPWGTRLSGILSYDSGFPYTVSRFSSTCDFNCQIFLNAKYPSHHLTTLDLALAKVFDFGGQRNLELRLDALNVFDQTIYNGYVGNANDDKFGRAVSADPNRTRRFQISARFNF